MMVYDDLTIEVALADPMIDLVRRADGIDRHDFAVLLRAAARKTTAMRLARPDWIPSGGIAASAAIAAREKSRGCDCAW